MCPQLELLNRVVKEKLCYERVDVNDYSSPDPKKKWELPFFVENSTWSYLEAAMNENIKFMDQIYHSRAIRK